MFFSGINSIDTIDQYCGIINDRINLIANGIVRYSGLLFFIPNEFSVNFI